MEASKRNVEIDLNKDLVPRIVQAVVKAVTEDAPRFRHENYLETNNAARFIAGDYINQNLREFVVDDQIRLHHFARYVWDGCLLIDHKNKVSYSIMTNATLAGGARKHGNKPYYLQSLLFGENGDCEGKYKQMTLADFAIMQGKEPFTDDDFTEDFDDIMKGEISIGDGYRHYIVAYTAERSEITEIHLEFLDRDFAEIDSVDLSEYITPDFAQLTNTYTAEAEVEDEPEKAKVQLKLKSGVKPQIRAVEKEA